MLNRLIQRFRVIVIFLPLPLNVFSFCYWAWAESWFACVVVRAFFALGFADECDGVCLEAEAVGGFVFVFFLCHLLTFL